LTYEKRGPENVAFAAAALAAGKIVGWFDGRLEFGPRALGNRSIFASPLAAGVKDLLNERIKFRERFRPYAAVITEEACGVYFDCATPSPFMLMVYSVRPEYRGIIPGVTHIDGTARVQTVNKTGKGRLRLLLEEFGRLTGHPVLINTSFNVRGEPMVASPEDAVSCFLRSGMDLLVMGEYAAVKPEGKKEWPGTDAKGMARSSGVPT
jgi:carbamoyltransferase